MVTGADAKVFEVKGSLTMAISLCLNGKIEINSDLPDISLKKPRLHLSQGETITAPFKMEIQGVDTESQAEAIALEKMRAAKWTGEMTTDDDEMSCDVSVEMVDVQVKDVEEI